MRLYHSRLFVPAPTWLSPVLLAGLIFLLAAGLSACGTGAASTATAQIQVQIAADGEDQGVLVAPGSTVQQALNAAGVNLSILDRVDPPAHAILTDGSEIKVTRVREEFEVEQVVLPFKTQILRNESLPLDTEIYLQKGQNGLEEHTFRRVFEDEVEVSSRAIIKRVVVEQPVTEIVMVGVQTPFVSIGIPGKMVYLRDGNAWLVEGTTGNRKAVVTTGDLDGRILSLSPDGNWLLFTRRSEEEGQINSLWAMQISTAPTLASGAQTPEPQPIDLKVPNVIHFADWMPGSNTKVIFSTVEPRAAAPGWQANNDLNALTFSPNGWVSRWQAEPILDANSGGIYGWWGTSFGYSPDRMQLAYARPDGVGLLDFTNRELVSVLDIIPLQTRSDWAWVPGLAWSPDGSVLYAVDHAPPAGSLSPEESQHFNLAALPLDSGVAIDMVSQAGMFAYPLTSPIQNESGDYEVAYLQAIFPEQSETSPYRVVLMDRDGSNQRSIFPGEDHAGRFSPQQNWGAWSPAPMPESGNYSLAVIYQGNLWLIDTVTGDAQQLTGDGLTERVIWQ